MGYSGWSDDAYKSISGTRKSMDPSTVKSAVFSRGLKPSLDPKGVKFRESRDSTEHPESNAIGVFFDVTGSMGGIPVQFATEKLGGLMTLLVSKGVIPHPQVLFGAIGDGQCGDRAPFQVGQFESGLEMDQCLTDIYIESGGGGNNGESYGLAHYFMANHSSIDCFEKRGKKGYLFTIGDERVLPVKRDEISRIFGDTVETDLNVTDLIRQCESKYEVFHIVVETASTRQQNSTAQWKDLLGERALVLDNPNDICELIASTIGLVEGSSITEMADLLRAAGTKDSTIKSVSTALAPLGGTGIVRAGTGALTGKLPDDGVDGTVRL